jgi:hypothetical protein
LASVGQKIDKKEHEKEERQRMKRRHKRRGRPTESFVDILTNQIDVREQIGEAGHIAGTTRRR